MMSFAITRSYHHETTLGAGVEVRESVRHWGYWSDSSLGVFKAVR